MTNRISYMPTDLQMEICTRNRKNIFMYWKWRCILADFWFVKLPAHSIISNVINCLYWFQFSHYLFFGTVLYDAFRRLPPRHYKLSNGKIVNLTNWGLVSYLSAVPTTEHWKVLSTERQHHMTDYQACLVQIRLISQRIILFLSTNPLNRLTL